jgi:hypothetical protein
MRPRARLASAAVGFAALLGMGVASIPAHGLLIVEGSRSDFGNVEPHGQGSTYFVSGTGDDGNSGSSAEDAFRTLQRAADLTAPGDTVYALDGEYTSGAGTNVLQIDRSGTEESWIRYEAYPGHTPTIRLDQNWGGISVDGASFVIVDGFAVVGGAKNVSREEAFAQMNNLDNIATIANGIAVAPAWDDASRKPHHVIIRNSTVSDCPGGGIYSSQTDYLRIEGNVVHGNAFWSPWGNSGISVYQSWNSDSSTATKVFIRGNVSYQNESIVPTYITDPDHPEKRVVSDGNGIIVDDARNTQSYSSEPGTPYQGRTLVENNLVYDNGGRGVNVYSSDHVDVRYNTSYRNGRTADIESELSVDDARDVQVASNIVVARKDKRATLMLRARDVTFVNNLYSGGRHARGEYPGGRFADPGFADPSSGNFEPLKGSDRCRDHPQPRVGSLGQRPPSRRGT